MKFEALVASALGKGPKQRSPTGLNSLRSMLKARSETPCLPARRGASVGEVTERCSAAGPLAGFTLLHVAAGIMGDVHLVRALLRAGADPALASRAP